MSSKASVTTKRSVDSLSSMAATVGAVRHISSNNLLPRIPIKLQPSNETLNAVLAAGDATVVTVACRDPYVPPATRSQQGSAAPEWGSLRARGESQRRLSPKSRVQWGLENSGDPQAWISGIDVAKGSPNVPHRSSSNMPRPDGFSPRRVAYSPRYNFNSGQPTEIRPRARPSYNRSSLSDDTFKRPEYLQRRPSPHRRGSSGGVSTRSFVSIRSAPPSPVGTQRRSPTGPIPHEVLPNRNGGSSFAYQPTHNYIQPGTELQRFPSAQSIRSQDVYHRKYISYSGPRSSSSSGRAYTAAKDWFSESNGSGTNVSALRGEGTVTEETANRRKRASGGRDYSPEAFRKLHGGVIPNIDPNDMRPTGSGRARPPVTRRTSTQYSKILVEDAFFASAGTDRESGPAVLSRRASYSSATGISPIAESQHHYNPPLASPDMVSFSKQPGRQSLTIDTHVSPHVDGALSSPSGSHGAPASSSAGMHFAPVGYDSSSVERKRVDDFDFANTIDSSTRPYTPDLFAKDLMAANKEKASIGTRTSSKRSMGSLASLGGCSRRSASCAIAPVRNGSINRNVLRKANPELRNRESGEGFTTVSSNGTLSRIGVNGLFNRNPSKVEDYVTDIPHTATTQAGPTRGVIKESTAGPETNSTAGGEVSPRFALRELKDPDRKKVEPMKFNGSSQPARNMRESAGNKALVRDLPRSSAEYSASPGQAPQRSLSDTTDDTSGGSPCTASMTTDPLSGKSFADSAGNAKYYISAIYRETGLLFRRTLSEGIVGAYIDFQDRRSLERSYRYGPAGRKIPMYMHGALAEKRTGRKFRLRERVTRGWIAKERIWNPRKLSDGLLKKAPISDAISVTSVEVHSGARSADTDTSDPQMQACDASVFADKTTNFDKTPMKAQLERREGKSNRNTGTCNKRNSVRAGPLKQLLGRTKEYWVSLRSAIPL